jgi:Glyoxalase/Bleomycin resistance protein/Dioxygenase superfamily
VTTCACCEDATGLVRLWSDKNLVVCYGCLDWMNAQRAKQMAASGGQVRVVGYEPSFSVLDVDRSVDHYQRLGFGTDYHDETYAFAHLGQLTLHLAHDDNPEHHQSGVLYLHVDDADQLAENWRKAGMEVEGPENQDYGKREGRHTDPDGNIIRFGSPIPN